jgi:hypothetical protein
MAAAFELLLDRRVVIAPICKSRRASKTSSESALSELIVTVIT